MEPTTQENLNKFVAECSDFNFEMRVLHTLRSLGMDCVHSGTYQDPITNKIRQFDIRARRELQGCRLALAVECKNLSPESPLLLSAVPRVTEEAFHQLIYTPKNGLSTDIYHVGHGNSPYKIGDLVAKQTDQVKASARGLTSDDKTTFEKIAQAVSSSWEFVRQYAPVKSQWLTAILPVLVLPERGLWQVDYSDDGSIVEMPRQLSQSTLFLDHAWSVRGDGVRADLNFRISHLEIVTIDALTTWLDAQYAYGGLFPYKQ
jgi:hypothetical protein